MKVINVRPQIYDLFSIMKLNKVMEITKKA